MGNTTDPHGETWEILLIPMAKLRFLQMYCIANFKVHVHIRSLGRQFVDYCKFPMLRCTCQFAIHIRLQKITQIALNGIDPRWVIAIDFH